MRALLVLGGDEIPFAREAEEADVIICADKGADWARGQGIVPDVVLGDMDSISSETLSAFEKENVKIITYPAEKDKTDGELGVDHAKEAGASHLDIVCAEGSIDHYLGNLYLLVYAKNASVEASLITRDMTVQLAEGEIELKGEKGTRVSILPARGEIEVRRTYGLYYEIEKPLSISFGQTIGLGNYMTGSACRIEMAKGTAFVAIDRRMPES